MRRIAAALVLVFAMGLLGSTGPPGEAVGERLVSGASTPSPAPAAGPASPSGVSPTPASRLLPAARADWAPAAVRGCPPYWHWASGTDPAGRQDILNAATTISRNDAWAVGFSGAATLVMRWVEGEWKRVRSPNVDPTRHTLTGVDALSPTEAWAVGSYLGEDGNQSLVLRYDGIDWSVVPSPNVPGENFLQSVVALSSTEAWAVGYSFDPQERVRTLILRYDGVSWKIFPSPNPSPSGNYLYGVSASPSGDLWAVGHRYDPTAGNVQTLALRYTDGIWTVVPTPNRVPGTANLLLGVSALGPSAAWAVGFANGLRGFEPVILRWNGSAWLLEDAPGAGRLFSVAAISPGDVWAVGENPAGTPDSFLEHWDGTRWTVVPVSLSEAIGQPPWWLDGILLGVTGHPGGRLLAVGVGWEGRGLGFALCEVAVGDGGFSKERTAVSLGNSAVWFFPGSNTQSHGVREDTGLGLFDSGPRQPGTSFTYAFTTPGRYRVLDPGTSETMWLNVPVQVDPRTGGNQTRFSIVWASDPLPGHVFDVQINRPGSSTWEDWRTDQEMTDDLFMPDAGTGTYQFRARLRNPVTGAASLYSLPESITVE